MNILEQSIIWTAKKMLYAGALLIVLNQDLSAQIKAPPQDKIFKTLEFQPFERDTTHQAIIDKINKVNSNKELFYIITQDEEVVPLFDKYLNSINKSRPVWETIMHWFLLSLWIAVDDKYNHLIIKWTTTIYYDNVIKKIPLLSSLKVINRDPIKIFLVTWTTKLHWASWLDWKIIIVDNNKTKDATLLNEITWELFSRYTKEIELIHPELVYNNHIFLPNKLWDPVLDKVLWSTIIEDQRNEYRWDLCNLSFDPSTHLEHVLQYAITEDWICHSYWYSKNPEIWKYKAAWYINHHYETYVMSKHQIWKYLLSKELLSTIKFQKSNLRNHYQTLIQKESKTQYSEKKISEKEYIDISKEITWYIQNDPQALQKIQQRAATEKEKLEEYLKSFQKE